jgi:flagellar hook-associated protein 2
LSSFGQMKSAVADAQGAARGLTGLTSSSSASDALAAATQFVARFNAAISAAQSGAAVKSGSPDATVGAARVQRELTHSLTNDTSMMTALRKMGFKTAADGTLSLDATKFNAALQADPDGALGTLAKAGHAVDKTAGSELGADGTLTHSAALLARRTADLKSQQGLMTALQQWMATQGTGATTSSSSTSASSGTNAGYGVRAYQSASQLGRS